MKTADLISILFPSDSYASQTSTFVKNKFPLSPIKYIREGCKKNWLILYFVQVINHIFKN
jgi:hypothetical protein